MNKQFTAPKLGILGGGQLGRMLIQAAIDLNIKAKVLDPDPNAPCKTIADEFIVGSLQDYDSVIAFGQGLSHITIEIEAVNTDALRALEKQGVQVYPQPHIIEMIQDKRLQKQFYAENDFPTSPFLLTNNAAEVKEHLEFLPAVHKCGKGGYDGKGVQVLETPNDIEQAFDVPSVLEKKVEIFKEISIIVARTQSGKCATFPTVECVYHEGHNLVDYLISPAEVGEAHQKKTKEIAIKLVEKLDFVGLLAIELFVDKAGNVLVNEVAPRPHNSGHQSIEGNITSQYAQLIRAVFDLPLGDTSLRGHSAMVNLLGEAGHEGTAVYLGLHKALEISRCFIHLYGKEVTKPFRKMGHVTIVGKDTTELLEKVNQVKTSLKVITE